MGLYSEDMALAAQDRRNTRWEFVRISETEANNRISYRIGVLEREKLSCTFFKERKQKKIDALKELQIEIVNKPLADAVKTIKGKHSEVCRGAISQTENLLDDLEKGHYYVAHQR